jgi:hypothetical protein
VVFVISEYFSYRFFGFFFRLLYVKQSCLGYKVTISYSIDFALLRVI